MAKLDTDRPLVMARFATVHGFNLNPGKRLAISDEPDAAGLVTPEVAQMLYASGRAVYADDFRPTPVATPEQEAAVVIARHYRQLAPGQEPGDIELEGVTEDLRVTIDRLREIAADEDVVLASADRKADMQRKIMEVRAARAGDLDAVPSEPVVV
jgi:hypothetical protein